MAEIAWHLLQPVDTGAQVMQGFQTGAALVKGLQTRSALGAYLQNPDDPGAYSALAYLDPQAAAHAQQQHMLQRKELVDRQDRERAVALGGLAAEDPAGAREEALRAGDFDLAKTFGELDETQQKKTAEFWGKAGSVAFQLKQKADPQERMALWAQARPILEAQGAPAHMLDQFDPTNDTQLDAAITTAQGIDKLIEQGRVTWHQQGEQPSFATDFMGRPVGTKNPYAGGGNGAPSSAGGFDAAVEHVLTNEGGYNPSDMNGAPVNFGINQGANPDLKVKDLTRDQAKQIYLERYWKPSGAESLPANMQAPYFDVYIRNPKIAKDALEQSGGDPQRFVDITSSYFQKLGTTDNGKKYAKAWANRDAKNRSIATGAAHVSSKAEYDGLPSGAEYIAPDGSHRRKP